MLIMTLTPALKEGCEAPMDVRKEGHALANDLLMRIYETRIHELGWIELCRFN